MVFPVWLKPVMKPKEFWKMRTRVTGRTTIKLQLTRVHLHSVFTNRCTFWVPNCFHQDSLCTDIPPSEGGGTSVHRLPPREPRLFYFYVQGHQESGLQKSNRAEDLLNCRLLSQCALNDCGWHGVKFDFQMRQQQVGFMDENATVGEWNGLDWTAGRSENGLTCLAPMQVMNRSRSNLKRKLTCLI